MARLDLNVNVDVKGANKLQDIGGKLRGVGTVMTAAVTAPIIGIGAATLKLAADAEESKARFQRAFDSMGAAAWTTAEDIEASVQELQKASTFGDEAIRDAAATLLTFGQVADEEFDRALQAGVDMATFLDKDLQDTIIQVGKAVNDPEKGMATLTRMGVQFDDEQEGIIRGLIEIGDTAGAQGVILAELEKQFGGAALAMTETAGGQMAQAMEKLKDAGESIGVLLLPILGELAGMIKGVAEWFIQLDDGTKEWIIRIAALAAVLGPVLLIVGLLIGALGTIATVLGLVLSPIGLIIGAVVLLGIAFATDFMGIRTIVETVVGAIIGFFSGLIDMIGTVIGAVVDFVSGLIDTFNGAVRALKRIGDIIFKPLGDGFKAAIDFIKGIWNTFVGWWNGINISVPAVDIPLIGRVGGFSLGLPKLPRLAEGGIVNQPTLALIGEAGPEAVVPLDRAGAGFGTNVTLNIYGDVGEDAERRLPGEMLRALYVAGAA
jgi:hypothetical protein